MSVPNSFFARPARVVAKDLPGHRFVRTEGKRKIEATIVEAEAFDGTDGRPTREGMSYAPGTIFVMPFRGNHFLNLCTGQAGLPSCVMVREIEVAGRPIKGPGRVAKALNIVAALDSKPLGTDLQMHPPTAEARARRVEAEGRSENSDGVFRLR